MWGAELQSGWLLLSIDGLCSCRRCQRSSASRRVSWRAFWTTPNSTACGWRAAPFWPASGKRRCVKTRTTGTVLPSSEDWQMRALSRKTCLNQLNEPSLFFLSLKSLCNTNFISRQPYHPAAQDRSYTEAKQGWAGQYLEGRLLGKLGCCWKRC